MAPTSDEMMDDASAYPADAVEIINSDGEYGDPAASNGQKRKAKHKSYYKPVADDERKRSKPKNIVRVTEILEKKRHQAEADVSQNPSTQIARHPDDVEMADQVMLDMREVSSDETFQ